MLYAVRWSKVTEQKNYLDSYKSNKVELVEGQEEIQKLYDHLIEADKSGRYNYKSESFNQIKGTSIVPKYITTFETSCTKVTVTFEISETW